jgi:hypothetical protein
LRSETAAPPNNAATARGEANSGGGAATPDIGKSAEPFERPMVDEEASWRFHLSALLFCRRMYG